MPKSCMSSAVITAGATRWKKPIRYKSPARAQSDQARMSGEAESAPAPVGLNCSATWPLSLGRIPDGQRPLELVRVRFSGIEYPRPKPGAKLKINVGFTGSFYRGRGKGAIIYLMRVRPKPNHRRGFSTMREHEDKGGVGLGAFAGVFTPSILTILGIILFLRLGFVVGKMGLMKGLVIIALANAISVITSISLSAAATNLRVKGGGDYYLISRTLGLEFGGALGLVLFLAQSVSIGFYCLGFGEGGGRHAGFGPGLAGPRP